VELQEQEELKDATSTKGTVGAEWAAEADGANKASWAKGTIDARTTTRAASVEYKSHATANTRLRP
jgi:hypothetical protein